MKIFKNLFLKNKKKIINKVSYYDFVDSYGEISKLVKEARIKKNITIEELSMISKIPKYTINAIENNLENHRPKNPFIRSILFKLEECLSLKKNTLVVLLIRDKKSNEKDKKQLLVKKFDFINTWEGTIIYFLILMLSIFILKRYFISNINVIEIKNIEEIDTKNKSL